MLQWFWFCNLVIRGSTRSEGIPGIEPRSLDPVQPATSTPQRRAKEVITIQNIYQLKMQQFFTLTVLQKHARIFILMAAVKLSSNKFDYTTVMLSPFSYYSSLELVVVSISVKFYTGHQLQFHDFQNYIKMQVAPNSCIEFRCSICADKHNNLQLVYCFIIVKIHKWRYMYFSEMCEGFLDKTWPCLIHSLVHKPVLNQPLWLHNTQPLSTHYYKA